MHTKSVKLIVNGQMITVEIPEGLQTAHGSGLDGVTQVKSLKFGESPKYPGKDLVHDSHGNTIMTNIDELIALTTILARAKGYKITATKL